MKWDRIPVITEKQWLFLVVNKIIIIQKSYTMYDKYPHWKTQSNITQEVSMIWILICPLSPWKQVFPTAEIIISVGWLAICKTQGPQRIFYSVGAGVHLLWSGGGGGQICLLSFCVCLELSDYWTFLQSLLSRAIFINFQATEKDLSHATPDC